MCGKQSPSTSLSFVCFQCQMARQVIRLACSSVPCTEPAEEEDDEEDSGAETPTPATIQSMKVADLKAELKKRGLDQKGLKKDLAKRLAASLKK